MKRNGMVDERYRKETSETEAPEVATSSESVLQRNCIAGDLQLAESRKQSRWTSDRGLHRRTFRELDAYADSPSWSFRSDTRRSSSITFFFDRRNLERDWTGKKRFFPIREMARRRDWKTAATEKQRPPERLASALGKFSLLFSTFEASFDELARKKAETGANPTGLHHK
jgi:hypothetical protein